MSNLQLINKLHFVYATPFKVTSLFQRIIRKVRFELNKGKWSIGLIGDRYPDEEKMSKWPIQSPYENTKNIYTSLSQNFDTKLYHLSENVKIKFNENDIFLGHPFFPYELNGKGVTESAVHSKQRPHTLALISPLHCDTSIKTTHINKDFLDHVDKLMPKTDILFAIMGQYWWDKWKDSQYSHWMPKMVRLDMAVNTDRYPKVKHKFNPPGKRKVLFIGKNDPMKGVNFLIKLAREMNSVDFAWIGSGPEIEGVKRISGFRQLDSVFMNEISKEYDFFISPSKADPNPTTILESMAWGFPVICTPQSGYYETPYLFNIYSDDIPRSIETLNKLQHLPENDLISISQKAREVVEKEYNWGKFTATIINNLNKN